MIEKHLSKSAVGSEECMTKGLEGRNCHVMLTHDLLLFSKEGVSFHWDTNKHAYECINAEYYFSSKGAIE